MRRAVRLVALWVMMCSVVAMAAPKHVGNGEWAFIPKGMNSIADFKAKLRAVDAYWQRYKCYWGLTCTKEEFLSLPWYSDNYKGETKIGVWKDGRPKTMEQFLDCEPVLIAVDCDGNKLTIVMDCGNPLPLVQIPCKKVAYCPPKEEKPSCPPKEEQKSCAVIGAGAGNPEMGKMEGQEWTPTVPREAVDNGGWESHLFVGASQQCCPTVTPQNPNCTGSPGPDPSGAQVR